MTARVARLDWYEAFCSDCRWSDEFVSKHEAEEAARTHNANYLSRRDGRTMSGLQYELRLTKVYAECPDCGLELIAFNRGTVTGRALGAAHHVYHEAVREAAAQGTDAG